MPITTQNAAPSPASGRGRPGVSYEQVAALAEEMTADGRTPSTRSIRTHLGTGSDSTIVRHLARWREQHTPAKVEAPSLAPTIQRAIIDEMNRAVADARATLEQDLAGARDEVSLLVDESEKTTAQIEELEATRSELDATTQQQTGTIDQLRVEIAAALAAGAAERTAAETARQELARTQLQLEDLPRLRAQIVDLMSSLETEKTARILAEKAEAVMAAKSEATANAIDQATAREAATERKLADAEGRIREVYSKLTAAAAEQATLKEQLHAAQITSHALAAKKPAVKKPTVKKIAKRDGKG